MIHLHHVLAFARELQCSKCHKGGHVKTSCEKQKCVAEGSSSAYEVIEDHICVHSIQFVDGDSLADHISC